MYKSLYIVRTHAINLTNLVLALLLSSSKDQLYYPCEYQISNKKFFNVKIGKFVSDALDLNTNITFRNIDWTQNVSYLNDCIAEKSVAFGTHRDDQISWAKDHYGNRATTIGISYTDYDYPMLLKNLSEYHIHLIQNGQLIMNSVDQRQFDILSTEQLIQYYTDLFDSMNLIPRNSRPLCDIDIPVSDFTHLEKMQAHFDKLELAFNQPTLTLYQSWIDGTT